MARPGRRARESLGSPLYGVLASLLENERTAAETGIGVLSFYVFDQLGPVWFP
jgi:hypothetical protein